MRARGLILDLFGDYLRYADAEIRLSQLCTLLADFGISPATTRVTLSRLRREGWFATRREGRETVYALTPGMLELLDEGRDRIFAPPATDWPGVWTMIIYQLGGSGRPERTQLRKALSWQGFGPLTTSTWMSPGDRRTETRSLFGNLVPDQVDVLCCRSEDLAHDRALARRCWDLPTLARQYEDFNAAHRPLLATTGRSGASALTARIELISTYRHFPFHDPRLPPQLRPAPWPGIEAFEIFRAVHDGLRDAARDHVARVIGRDILLPLPT